MTNIFGNPARENKLESNVKSQASSVRGGFKTDVRVFPADDFHLTCFKVINSVKNNQSLAATVLALTEKYKRATLSHADVPSEPSDVLGIEIRVALLVREFICQDQYQKLMLIQRHFCYKNPTYSADGKDDAMVADNANKDSGDNSVSGSINSGEGNAGNSTQTGESVPKKQKTTGKMKKSESFWGAFEAWIDKLRQENGTNYADPRWKR